MSDPKQLQTDNAVSQIAARMQKDGMSTADIMTALFKSLNNNSTLGIAIAAEGRLATLKNELNTTVDATVREFNALIKSTSINIENIRTVKTLAARADSFQNELNPHISTVQAFEEKRKEYLESTRVFATDMNKAFQELREVTKNPDSKREEDLREKIKKLNENIQNKMEQAKKNLMDPVTIKGITNQIRTTYTNVAQSTAASGQPISKPEFK
jgi:hypothetical protein